MPTIQASIQLYNGMTPALKSMSNALNIVISSMESMQRLSHKAVDTASLQAARGELAQVNAQFMQMDGLIQQAANRQQQFNNQVQQGKTEAGGLIGNIKNMVGAYAGLYGLKQTLGISDELARTTARIKLMTGEEGNAKAAMDSIYASAQRTRTAYMGTADAVAKLGLKAAAYKAIAGTNDTKFMTPAMTKSAMDTIKSITPELITNIINCYPLQTLYIDNVTSLRRKSIIIPVTGLYTICLIERGAYGYTESTIGGIGGKVMICERKKFLAGELIEAELAGMTYKGVRFVLDTTDKAIPTSWGSGFKLYKPTPPTTKNGGDVAYKPSFLSWSMGGISMNDRLYGDGGRGIGGSNGGSSKVYCGGGGKSENGALASQAGWKGLCRKGVTLLIVLVLAD